MRPGVTSMMRALPCTESVMTPAWLPVNDRALAPRFWIAMASSAIEMRSPAVSSMSSSRPGGSGDTCCARSSSSSVVSPMALTTTQTSWPALRVATMRSATRLMRSASETDEPPYFCTTRPMVGESRRVPGLGCGGMADVIRSRDERICGPGRESSPAACAAPSATCRPSAASA